MGQNLLPDLVKILFKVQFLEIIGHLVQQAAKQEQAELQSRKQQKLLKMPVFYRAEFPGQGKSSPRRQQSRQCPGQQ